MKRVLLLVLFLIVISFARNSDSKYMKTLETSDYCVAVKVSTDGYHIYVADLVDYKGSSNEVLDTKEYDIAGNCVKDVIAGYEKLTNRNLDMNHIRKIIIEKRFEELDAKLLDLSEYVNVSESVKLKFKEGGEKNFREVIRSIYNGNPY